jgi:hypothetical protein
LQAWGDEREDGCNWGEVEEDFLQRSRVTQQSLFLTRDCKHEEMRGRMPLGRKKWKRKRISCSWINGQQGKRNT